MQVAVVGAGRMGAAMALRVQQGEAHTVRALARSEATRQALRAQGIDTADSLAQAVDGAQVVLVVVFSDAQVRQVCLGPDGLVGAVPRGSTVVVHTTCNPATLTTVAEVFGASGVAVVDAPVSGGPPDIARGALTLFVAGRDDDVDTVRPVLACYGSPIVAAGPLGSGQRLKLVNNALFAAHVELAAAAIRLGTSLGLPEQTVVAGVAAGSGARPVIPMVAAAGGIGPLATGLHEFLAKDIATVRAVAAGLEVDLGLLGTVLAADALGRERRVSATSSAAAPRTG